MSIDWGEALRPEATAVLCMEMQRGVLAPEGPFPQLLAAVKKHDVLNNGATVLAAARAAGIAVVHCTAAFRPDRKGTLANTPLVASLLKNERHMLEGTAAVDVITQWRAPGDMESRRYHGVSPFTATNLHDRLCSRTIETLIVMGVSLNLGVTGLCVEAANLGYRVVVVEDAVAGFPDDYAQAVMANTLSLISKLMHSDEIVAHLRQPASPEAQ